MSQWRPNEDNDTYYILVDSNPAEIVNNYKPDTIFCTAFVDTSSCINGVKNPDLPWFKQYKDCESLDESKNVISNLIEEIKNGSFQNLYVWLLSSDFSTIDRNGLELLKGAEKEVLDLSVAYDYVKYKNIKYKIDKAKMLIWYNFCLCNMATYLVDKTLQWKKKRAIFYIDRIGDSDKRIQDFMRMVMFETSIHTLWKRCAEDYGHKPRHVGYEFLSQYDANNKIVPANDSMQASLVDWIVLAAYAEKNGIESRDSEFQALIVNLIQLLISQKQINGMHFAGDIRWE